MSDDLQIAGLIFGVVQVLLLLIRAEIPGSKEWLPNHILFTPTLSYMLLLLIIYGIELLFR